MHTCHVCAVLRLPDDPDACDSHCRTCSRPAAAKAKMARKSCMNGRLESEGMVNPLVVGYYDTREVDGFVVC